MIVKSPPGNHRLGPDSRAARRYGTRSGSDGNNRDIHVGFSGRSFPSLPLRVPHRRRLAVFPGIFQDMPWRNLFLNYFRTLATRFHAPPSIAVNIEEREIRMTRQIRIRHMKG
ncbi:MAG: hypothetical protein ACKV2V_06315, partial [Blastocatellia bacterium]